MEIKTRRQNRKQEVFLNADIMFHYVSLCFTTCENSHQVGSLLTWLIALTWTEGEDLGVWVCEVVLFGSGSFRLFLT